MVRVHVRPPIFAGEGLLNHEPHEKARKFFLGFAAPADTPAPAKFLCGGVRVLGCRFKKWRDRPGCDGAPGHFLPHGRLQGAGSSTMSTLHPAPYIVFFAVFFGRLALWQLQNVLMGRGAFTLAPRRLSKEEPRTTAGAREISVAFAPARKSGAFTRAPAARAAFPHGGCPVVFRRPGCTGGWRMPWRQEAMKDAASCDKPRGGACRL